MQLPTTARVPEPGEDCGANIGIRQLAGVFATTMLSPGQADIVPVELSYADGEKDVVFLISGDGYTALAGVLFGPEGSSSPQFLEWAGALRPLIQDALDVYDRAEEAPGAPVVIDLPDEGAPS